MQKKHISQGYCEGYWHTAYVQEYIKESNKKVEANKLQW